MTDDTLSICSVAFKDKWKPSSQYIEISGKKVPSVIRNTLGKAYQI